MNASTPSAVSPWIHSSKIDLFYFTFGWVLILIAWAFIHIFFPHSSLQTWVIKFVLLVTVFHRHLTFPLVYGDPQQFEARKKSYILLPIFFFVLTYGSLFYVSAPSWLSAEVPSAVQLTSKDSLVFRVKNKNYTVSFKGTEKTLPELAATLQNELQGIFQVSIEKQKLRVTLLNADKDSNLLIRSEPRNSILSQQLGFDRPNKSLRAERPILVGLIVLSLVWNFYHTLMQKMGVLRVYSRKAKYGKAWLDKAMVFSWFGFLFFQVGSMPSQVKRISYLSTSGKHLVKTLQPVLEIFPYLAPLAFLFAAVVTFFYIKEEFSNRHQLHWPKNLFMLSILLLYGLFFYDFLMAYVAFGFSHAIEYLAFVNIFSRKKFLPQSTSTSWMAWAVHRQTFSMGLFVVASSVLFIPWHYLSNSTLKWYILASSFLHFLYDGWIWKVRQPQVGKPLGIEYQPQLQTAA